MNRQDVKLPPDNADMNAILEKQQKALADFPLEVMRVHRSQLGLPGDASSTELALLGLITELYRSLDALTGSTDLRRTDPLAFHARNVSPILKLQQSQGSPPPNPPSPLIDLGERLQGYNWHAPESVPGFPAWRWMGPGPQSGIMIPALPGLRTLRVVGRSSTPAQDSELKIKLNGYPLRVLSDRKKDSHLHLHLEVPGELKSSVETGTFPWYVLSFEVLTLFQPGGQDPRSLGYGIGQLELLVETP